ncbi:hypothetical protein WA026_008261 [Henosepilachna vigintioctopunctata]|uniref:Uncharacterized protein n=1 Tax=Henosepilachna vigintioctopunctata TaxID=420089 RepID=A0AAW1TU50_9CUCU
MYEIQHIRLKYRRIKYVVIISSEWNGRIRKSDIAKPQISQERKAVGVEGEFIILLNFMCYNSPEGLPTMDQWNGHIQFSVSDAGGFSVSAKAASAHFALGNSSLMDTDDFSNEAREEWEPLSVVVSFRSPLVKINWENVRL